MQLPDHQEFLIYRARMLALDLERHARQESAQGQMSPTDHSLYARVIDLLRHDIARSLTGNPLHGEDQTPKDHWL